VRYYYIRNEPTWPRGRSIHRLIWTRRPRGSGDFATDPVSSSFTAFIIFIIFHGCSSCDTPYERSSRRQASLFDFSPVPFVQTRRFLYCAKIRVAAISLSSLIVVITISFFVSRRTSRVFGITTSPVVAVDARYVSRVNRKLVVILKTRDFCPEQLHCAAFRR